MPINEMACGISLFAQDAACKSKKSADPLHGFPCVVILAMDIEVHPHGGFGMSHQALQILQIHASVTFNPLNFK